MLQIRGNNQPAYLLQNLMQLDTLTFPLNIADNMLELMLLTPNLKNISFTCLIPADFFVYFAFTVVNNFTEETPYLESFDLRGDMVSDTVIEQIAKNWPKLRTLALNGRRAFDLSPIKFCQNLRTLKLNWEIDSVQTFFNEIPTLRKMQVKNGEKTQWHQW